MKRELILGWMGNPFKIQLKGLRLKAEVIEHFQKDNDAISRLGIRGLITEHQRDAAYDKLAKNIKKAIPTPPSGQGNNGGEG